ncbi:claudin 15-like b isoform X1 [Chanos chanos]|uniref:Claudin n=1 Tax=Chanos chanos TaxID=29144 RepID=A0A6J2VSJ9_CHACN|nr:claudin-19-like isoform X1 [Chanos chanos]XP_030634666.1 claudin-19-like isoform X1 [Chanos chanos]
MAVLVVQVLGLVLGALAWSLESTCTNSKRWKVHSHMEAVVTSSSQFEGLWMTCATNSMGAIQCQRFKTVLGLPGYIQACRALMIIALLLGLFSMVLSILGLKCTKLGSTSPEAKGKLALTAGILFILSGLCTLSAVSWYAARVVQEFYDPFFGGTKFELGAGLYLGWAAAALAILGGGMLCSSCKTSTSGSPRGNYTYNYTATAQDQKIYRTPPSSAAGSSKAYV